VGVFSLLLLDISEPASLHPIGNIVVAGVSGWPAPVPALDGNILYTGAADVIDRFGVVDISDPANPVLVNTIPTWSDGICGMSVTDRYLIATSCAGTGIRLYDLSDPLKPVEAGQFELSGLAHAVADDTLYVTDSDGIRVLNISDPAHPAEVGRLALPFGIGEMVAAGDALYMLAGDGIWALNVSDRTRPYLSGHLQLPRHDFVNFPSDCSHCQLRVDGDWLYVALGNAGLFVVQVEK
jgi:hypothetical protein